MLYFCLFYLTNRGENGKLALIWPLLVQANSALFEKSMRFFAKIACMLRINYCHFPRLSPPFFLCSSFVRSLCLLEFPEFNRSSFHFPSFVLASFFSIDLHPRNRTVRRNARNFKQNRSDPNRKANSRANTHGNHETPRTGWKGPVLGCLQNWRYPRPMLSR